MGVGLQIGTLNIKSSLGYAHSQNQHSGEVPTMSESHLEVIVITDFDATAVLAVFRFEAILPFSSSPER